MMLKRADFVQDDWARYCVKYPFLKGSVFLDAQELYCNLFDNDETRHVDYYGQGFKEELADAFDHFRKKHGSGV